MLFCITLSPGSLVQPITIDFQRGSSLGTTQNLGSNVGHFRVGAVNTAILLLLAVPTRGSCRADQTVLVLPTERVWCCPGAVGRHEGATMRPIFLFLLLNYVHVLGFLDFSRFIPFATRRRKYDDEEHLQRLGGATMPSPEDGAGELDDQQLTGYRKGVSVTGRVFVTMFGYPSKCERKGSSHSCTLSFACWLVGGSSQPGCGANSWLVACCVTSSRKNTGLKNHQKYFEQIIQVREELPPPAMQKRIDDFVPSPVQEQECGISSDRVLRKRIIGGNEAAFGQFPWQAYIKISTYQCGGVLVSRKFVATAAHCIITARLSDVLVYLGELDTQDTGKVTELAPAELHRVRRRIVHPKFQYRTTQPDRFDLALLELVTEAGYAFHISPICLPEVNLPLKGRNAVVAGWGKIQPSNELMGTNVLRSATVPILDIRDCMAWHRIKQISVELYDEMLCAGHENGKHDACLGDSGGPLIVLEKGRWTLAGITSAGFGCGESHQPGIYHRVPVTTEWIRKVVTRV